MLYSLLVVPAILRPPEPVIRADITLAFTASPIAKDNIVVQAAKVSSALRYLTR